MNPLNLFKYLEKEKGKPIPLRIKLIMGLPLTPEELDVKGYLNLDETPIKFLPPGLKVEGDLLVSYTDITSLPQGLQVGGDLELVGTEITSLPHDLKVKGNIWLRNTPLAGKSDDEILAMLKKNFFKTGYIKGFIDT